jgi:primase-polymerase (primpol)-like protein
VGERVVDRETAEEELEGTDPPADPVGAPVEAVEEPAVPPTGKLPVGPPEELRPRPQWVAWRAETTPDGRPVKPPYRPSDPRRRADVSDPATWGSNAEALEASSEGRVGFVLTAGDPYAVVDLDGCRDPDTGELAAWAREVVEALDSYTEISPSGRGLHVWVRGVLPGQRRRSGGVELYDQARYVTVTGQALPGYGGRGIAERGSELAALYRRLFGVPEASAPPAQYPGPNTPPTEIPGDGELLGRAMRVAWFPAVWGGDDSHYGGDPSKGDYWVCRALALYSRDPAQIERLARSSPRAARAKSERADYWPRTVEAALRHTPPRRPGAPPTVHTRGGVSLESRGGAQGDGEAREGDGLC